MHDMVTQKPTLPVVTCTRLETGHCLIADYLSSTSSMFLSVINEPAGQDGMGACNDFSCTKNSNQIIMPVS